MDSESACCLNCDEFAYLLSACFDYIIFYMCFTTSDAERDLNAVALGEVIRKVMIRILGVLGLLASDLFQKRAQAFGNIEFCYNNIYKIF